MTQGSLVRKCSHGPRLIYLAHFLGCVLFSSTAMTLNKIMARFFYENGL
jgi:hypothetical protein